MRLSALTINSVCSSGPRGPISTFRRSVPRALLCCYTGHCPVRARCDCRAHGDATSSSAAAPVASHIDIRLVYHRVIDILRVRQFLFLANFPRKIVSYPPARSVRASVSVARISVSQSVPYRTRTKSAFFFFKYFLKKQKWSRDAFVIVQVLLMTILLFSPRSLLNVGP